MYLVSIARRRIKREKEDGVLFFFLGKEDGVQEGENGAKMCPDSCCTVNSDMVIDFC